MAENNIKIGVQFTGKEEVVSALKIIADELKMLQEQERQFSAIRKEIAQEESAERKLANMQIAAFSEDLKRTKQRDMEVVRAASQAQAQELTQTAQRMTVLLNVVSALELKFKQGTITQQQYASAVGGVKTQIDKLNLSFVQKNTVDKNLFQSQERVNNQWRSMSGAIGGIQKSVNTANQTLIGFSQGMQDASQFSMGFNQGLRGIANNIQQTVQMFTLLRNQAGGAKSALSLLWQSLATPAGALIGLAAITTAIQIIPTLLGDATKEAERLKDILKEIADIRFSIAEKAFKLGILSEAQYKALLDSRVNIAKKALLNAMPGAGLFGLKDADLLKPIDQLFKNINGGIDVSNEKTRELVDLQDKYVQALTASANLENKKKEEGSKGGSGKKIDPNKYEQPYDEWVMQQSERIRIKNEQEDIESQLRQFNSLEKIKARELQLREQGWKHQEEMENHINDVMKKNADERAKRYDNLFFDPIKQGFSDINSSIRNNLFGSLDELKNKFGAVGASIIQALQNIIAKLIETAILATILSVVSGGTAGGGMSFITAFKGLAGGKSAGSLLGFDNGGLITEPVIGRGMRSGRPYSFAENNPEYVVNPYKYNSGMNFNAPQTVHVIVEGKIKNKYIALANSSENSLESLTIA